MDRWMYNRIDRHKLLKTTKVFFNNNPQDRQTDTDIDPEKMVKWLTNNKKKEKKSILQAKQRKGVKKKQLSLSRWWIS